MFDAVEERAAHTLRLRCADAARRRSPFTPRFGFLKPCKSRSALVCAELEYQQRQAQPEISWAKKRVAELAEERKRLARGVVDGSVPGDLARDEHDRIAHELEQANQTLAAAQMVYTHIEDTLSRALALIGRCDEVYRMGGPQVRRLSNQFFFEKLLIAKDTEGSAHVAEPHSTSPGQPSSPKTSMPR